MCWFIIIILQKTKAASVYFYIWLYVLRQVPNRKLMLILGVRACQTHEWRKKKKREQKSQGTIK